MSYHRDNQTSPYVEGAFVVAIISLVLAIVYATPFMSWVSHISHGIFNGGLHDRVAIEDTTETTNMLINMSEKQMVERIKILQDELFVAKTELLDVNRLTQENNNLRALLNVASSSARVVATLRITKRPPQSSYDTVILDGGSDQGLIIGQQVIAAGTVYLGDVVQVFPETSVVALLTTQGIARDVQSVRTGVTLPTVGHNGSHVVLEVPRDVDIVEGDQFTDVLSHKLSLVVYKVTFDDREPFKTVYARSPINIRHLDWVQVLNNISQ